jgi:hypothetical protein
MNRRFHGERGEKVADAQHMALGCDRGIRRCLPTEPAKRGIGLDMAVGQVAQVGMAGRARQGPVTAEVRVRDARSVDPLQIASRSAG